MQTTLDLTPRHRTDPGIEAREFVRDNPEAWGGLLLMWASGTSILTFVRVTTKWGRPQHHVDYRGFRRNALKLREGVVVPEGTDDYGMGLRIEEEAVRGEE
jgi:hypothetical protein